MTACSLSSTLVRVDILHLRVFPSVGRKNSAVSLPSTASGLVCSIRRNCFRGWGGDFLGTELTHTMREPKLISSTHIKSQAERFTLVILAPTSRGGDQTTSLAHLPSSQPLRGCLQPRDIYCIGGTRTWHLIFLCAAHWCVHTKAHKNSCIHISVTK